MRKIIFTNADGGISIVHPVRNTIGETLITDAEIEQRAWNKLPDNAINPQYVEDSAIPIDRTFRNAWEQNGNSVIYNMTKAKEIAKNNLRAERAPVLSALDIQFQRALESANTDLQTSIAEQKQTLRDITAHETIVNASDVNALKTAMNTLIEEIKA